jgi:tetratricopeptide (TPR) repeat protein
MVVLKHLSSVGLFLAIVLLLGLSPKISAEPTQGKSSEKFIDVFQISHNIEHQQIPRHGWQRVETFARVYAEGRIRIQRSSDLFSLSNQANVRVICEPLSEDKARAEEYIEISLQSSQVVEFSQLDAACNQEGPYGKYESYLLRHIDNIQDMRDALPGMGNTWIGGNNSSIPYLVHPRSYFVSVDRPRIRWHPVPNASRYTIMLERVDPYRVNTSPIWQRDQPSSLFADRVQKPEKIQPAKHAILQLSAFGLSPLEIMGYPTEECALSPNEAYRLSVVAFDANGQELGSSKDEAQQIEPIRFSPRIDSKEMGTQGLAFRYWPESKDRPFEKRMHTRYQKYLDDRASIPQILDIINTSNYFDNRRSFGESIELLVTTLSTKPDAPLIPLVYLRLGRVYLRSGLTRLAADTFTTLIDRVPESGEGFDYVFAKIIQADAQQWLGKLYIQTNLSELFAGIKLLKDAIRTYEAAAAQIPPTDRQRSRVKNAAAQLQKYINKLEGITE